MRFGRCTRATLTLCFAYLALFGCSGEDEGTGRGGEVVEVGGGRGTADEPGGYVRIERAYLSSAGDADFMDARVRFAGEAVWPDCFLVEGPTAEAMERMEEGGPPVRGRVDSTWASRDSTEQKLLDDTTLLVSFRKAPGSEAPDPDRSPYFVFCGSGEEPFFQGQAHVIGTPES